jgi:hypothetical protein
LILKSNADGGESWREDMVELGKLAMEIDLQESLEVMKEYITDLERHRRVVDSLLDRLSGTSKLVYSNPPSFKTAKLT